MYKFISIFLLLGVLSHNVSAWGGKVTNILQHGNAVAVTISPDPGKGNCDAGSPYILTLDDTEASKQRFSMLLAALMSGKSISGYDDPCVSAIWGVSRPSIVRLNLSS